jgi:hypothetical protein
MINHFVKFGCRGNALFRRQVRQTPDVIWLSLEMYYAVFVTRNFEEARKSAQAAIQIYPRAWPTMAISASSTPICAHRRRSWRYHKRRDRTGD